MTDTTARKGIGAGGLLSLGLRCAQRRTFLLWPLVGAELAATLTGLVPLLLLAARVLVHAERSSAPTVQEALLEGLMATLGEPGPWALAGVGAMLAAAGGWLLRTTAAAGAVRTLAGALASEAPPAENGFLESISRSPSRWLAAAAVAGLLRLLVIACAVGAVASAMFVFKHHPGAPAALAMTVATSMAVLLPYLDAALEIGFVRSVLVDEPVHAALGEGVLLAFRKSSAILPTWALLAMADLAIAVGLNAAMTSTAALPASAWAWRLGPQAMAWAGAATATALVTLVRLAAWAAAIADDAGLLPSEPPPGPAPERVLEAVAVGPEPVLEAVAVEPGPSPEPSEPGKPHDPDGGGPGAA